MVRTSTGSASPSAEEAAPTLPPEGRLLLYTNDGPVILSHADDAPMYLERPGEAFWANDLSPDDSKVLALSFQQDLVTKVTSVWDRSH